MIKEKIVNFFIPKNIISEILAEKYPITLKIIIFLTDLTRMLRFYLQYGGEFRGLKNKEWISEYNISREDFLAKNKKDGISAYARLKNASDFLWESIESVIEYFDEIILVENNSSDNTWEICKKLQQKFPEKIKIFQYSYEVFPLFSEEFARCPENSVHNFAYMSNFALSKVSYKYALKIDDDGILISENILPFLKNIRTNGIKNFYITPLINVQKKSQKFVIGAKNYRSAFAGLFADMGFHPVSPRIYFHSNGKTEGYVHNYFCKYLPITFLHLKLLKPQKWFSNYHNNGLLYLENNYWDTDFLLLESKYTDLLHQYKIYENW